MNLCTLDYRCDPSANFSEEFSNGLHHSSLSGDEPASSLESSSTSDSSINIDDLFGVEPALPSTSCATYKLVGDNIDKHVTPREMRMDHQARTLHYFNSYAVRDRIDLSQFSDEVKIPDVKSIQLDSILPTIEDEEMLKNVNTCHFSRSLGRGHWNVILHTNSLLKWQRNQK